MDHSDPVEPKDGHVKASLTWEQLSLLKRSMSFESDYADRMTLSFAYKLWTTDLEHGDGASILREIAALEGAGAPTGTKSEERFKKPPLDRFWHKHFFHHGISTEISGYAGEWNTMRMATGPWTR